MAYSDFSLHGSARVWLTLEESGRNSNGIGVELDEIHLYGGAQVAFIKPKATRNAINIVIGK